VRTPDLIIYSNSHFQESTPYLAYEEDISPYVHVSGDDACGLGLRQGTDLVVFVGNTNEHVITTALRVNDDTLSGAYRCRTYNSLRGEWIEEGELLPAERLRLGVAMQIEHKGFCLFDLKQEV
jgi:hypothetical protein